MTEEQNKNHGMDVKEKGFLSGNPKLNDFLKDKSKQKPHVGPENCEIPQDHVYNNPLLIAVQRKVIDEINPAIIKDIEDEGEIKNHLEQVLAAISNREYPTLTNRDKTQIIQSLLDEFTGYGPVQKLILDDTVSEIMINGPSQIYVEKRGQISLTDLKFRNEEHVMQIIDKIVSPLGRRIDESSPMVDARLPNGSRVNAIIPPLSLKGPVLTIRKFAAQPFTMELLVQIGTLNEKISKFLDMAVRAKVNIIVAGGTGSGKTTLLNVLSSCIPPGERIITIEDAAELRLHQPHVIPLEARPANIEGKGEITIRDLVRNSLRMRPDRIVVGEVRGQEALDMLQAMNTGHRGSLSTVHANAARDALARLETMVLYSGIDFPLRAIREQICSALELIVYIERLADGNRKVTSITEVLGLEGDIIVLQDVFRFERANKTNGTVRGDFVVSPVRPKIFDKFQSLGLGIPFI